MGGGKGVVDHYVAVVRPGTVLFEMAGVTESIACEAFRLAGHKFGVKTTFVTKEIGRVQNFEKTDKELETLLSDARVP